MFHGLGLSDMSERERERPTKRARGSYAKLICFRCRERRIKCQLPDDDSVQPSNNPQPPDKACTRCQQQGLDCIVRKTTLGRPSQKKPNVPTPPSTGRSKEEFRSPSPETEGLVLMDLGGDSNEPVEQTATLHRRPTGPQLMGAINKTFDLTSSLLARDRRFGNLISELQDMKPKKVEEIVSEDLAISLDQYMVWLRLYMPWTPNLVTVHRVITSQHLDSGTKASGCLLLALLVSMALDLPYAGITTDQRKIQRELLCIIYHSGQRVLFTLPRHEYTLSVLELVHGYRPLALITTQQAAAHTLSGKLYPTLRNVMAQRLGLNAAPLKLHEHLKAGQNENVSSLVVDSLRWCTTLLYEVDMDLEELEGNHSDYYQPEVSLQQALDGVAKAIDRGWASTESFFAYHMFRYIADDLLTIRKMTLEWQDLVQLATHVHNHEQLRDQRKKHFDHGISQVFYSQSRTEEALALSQLSNMELNHGRTTVIGLAMFYAIVSGAKAAGAKAKETNSNLVKLSKFYTEALDSEEYQPGGGEKSIVRLFLDRYADIHMDGLERRLTDFINAAAEVRLDGVPFVGPPRHTTANVLLACKEIVENNAVRIRIHKQLHHRLDMQLILFQEAARRLEAMEHDGGSSDAVARGSIFAASAKLIRSLHRIMSQWKRNDICSQQSPSQTQQNSSAQNFALPTPGKGQAPIPNLPPIFDPDGLFADDFFTDWDNWPQLDPAELSSFLNYDLDLPTM